MGTRAFQKTAFEPSAFEMTRDYSLVSAVYPVVLSGIQNRFVYARTATLDGGSYTSAGATIYLSFGRYLAGSPTTFSHSGEPVSLRATRYAAIDTAPFSIAGVASSLMYGRAFTGSVPYTVTPGVTLVRLGLNFPVFSGSVNVGGQNVGVLFGHYVKAEDRIFNSDGFSANTLVARYAQASSGSYTEDLSGNLLFDRRLASAANGFLLVGEAVVPRADRKLFPDVGNYNYVGKSAITPKGFHLRMMPDAFNVAGFVAETRADRKFFLDDDAVAVSGKNLQLTKRLILRSNGTAFALVGQPLDIIARRYLKAEDATYFTSGKSIQTIRRAYLPLAKGSYLIAGKPTRIFRTLLPLVAVSGQYLVNGRPAKVFFSSFASPDPEIMFADWEAQYFLVEAEDRYFIVPSEPDNGDIYELPEYREMETAPRRRQN